MIRLDRIIKSLRPELRECVYAMYGGKQVAGFQSVATALSINRRTVMRRIFEADRAISEALDDE